VSNAPRKSLADNRALELPFNRYVVFFVIAACGCAADLVTKQVVFNWLGIPPDYLTPDPAVVSRWRGDPQLNHLWWLWDQHFGFQTSLNRGALFGMGAGGWWIFASLSVIAFFGILTWLFVYRAAYDRWITVALGCVTGGILGNLYDRLALWNSVGLKPEFQHSVRDWILFQWKGIPLLDPWPNFNIADSLLVTGAIMLVVHAIVWRDNPQPSAKKAIAA
jgi:signal peptidase II